ncbi:hypothetical protein [Methanocella arvoryzae]|uniref:Uncharacterized protein n=1 Tax=Methanocella arvoryzae (strain DSM 22066 / NBRC 105507 / MRE50) TaxID=351160 RepID=Q0W2X5_METAR|nr:hypothetical protein [Methanocella arvoryzae]CAJ37268.1 hypothetical protein RCIX2140 [Methanocella arvoryzae MRE50]
MLMKTSIKGFVALACVIIALTISGCVCFNIGTPGDTVPTPEPMPEPTDEPTLLPTETPAVPTVSPDGHTPTPATGTAPTSTPGISPAPVTGTMDARMIGYGTDKDTYSRGDTALCYVEIENTGEVPIDMVDFRVDVYRSAFGVMIRVIDNETYTVDNQDIQPGETKRVEIAVVIPAEYQGVSTAGTYKFDIVVSVEGKEIGRFSKDVKVV